MDISASNLNAQAIRTLLAEEQRRRVEAQHREEAAAKAEREKLHASFLTEEIAPDAMERLARMVRMAITRGDSQVLVFRFPSEWLADHGRSITDREPDWHVHLEGFAQRAYAYFVRELKPRGFQMRAEILDWPGGMPGDVGFFLQWGGPDAA